VLTEAERARFGSPVGFIGFGTESRAQVLAYLLEQGVPLSICGNGFQTTNAWPRIKHAFRSAAVFGEEYPKAICGLDIALHFLRAENRDEQDSRTFEIPACRTFMLAERSPAHARLFRDGIEAVFFDSPEQCLAQIQHFLRNSAERTRIAHAGHQKSIDAGYDHHSRLRSMLATVAKRLDLSD
jgi:hypothetical protein